MLVSWGHRAGLHPRGRAARARPRACGGRATASTSAGTPSTGRQCLLGATRSGAALQRVLDLLGVGQDGRAELERAALEAPATAGGIELHGLYDDHVALTGIGDGVSPALAWRAALESIGRVQRRDPREHDAPRGSAGPPPAGRRLGRGSGGPGREEAHLGAFELPGAVYMGARGAALTAGRAAGFIAAPRVMKRSPRDAASAGRRDRRVRDRPRRRYRRRGRQRSRQGSGFQPRPRLSSPRRFFASSRRRLLAFVGRVAVRGRRTSRAWASRSARRCSASSRLRSCERVS